MPKKNRMISFELFEISAVDRPAQEHAKMTIMKRDTADDETSAEEIEALSKQLDELSAKAAGLAAVINPPSAADTIAKYYIDPADGAMAFTSVLERSLESKRYYEVCEEVGPVMDALNTSLHSIAGDSDMSTLEKQNMMRASIEDFMASVRSKWPDVEEALAKAFTPGEAGDSEGEKDMEKLKEQIAALEKQVGGLTTQLEAATKAGKDPKIAADAQKQADELTAKVAELTEALEASKAELDAEKARAKLTDKEKEYMDRMEDEEDKKKFLAATPEARKALIEKAASNDEEITVAGQTIRKSAVGEAAFAVFKAQAAQTDELQKKLNAETELRQTAEYTKRAEAELHELPGETAAKAQVLKVIDGMEKDVKETLTAMLTAGGKAIKAAFETLGHHDGQVTRIGKEAVVAFEKRVNEIAARDKVGKDTAMQTARKEYPEEFKAYQAAQ